MSNGDAAWFVLMGACIGMIFACGVMVMAKGQTTSMPVHPAAPEQERAAS